MEKCDTTALYNRSTRSNDSLWSFIEDVHETHIISKELIYELYYIRYDRWEKEKRKKKRRRTGKEWRREKREGKKLSTVRELSCLRFNSDANGDWMSITLEGSAKLTRLFGYEGLKENSFAHGRSQKIGIKTPLQSRGRIIMFFLEVLTWSFCLRSEFPKFLAPYHQIDCSGKNILLKTTQSKNKV